MVMTEDGFAIDVVLRHATSDPATYTKTLSLEPDFAWMSGASLGNQVMRSTRWQARLAIGTGEIEYETALQMVVSFLDANASFFRQLQEEAGEAELVMNYAAISDEGKVLELSYDPAFLRKVVDLGIGLRVLAWSGESE